MTSRWYVIWKRMKLSRECQEHLKCLSRWLLLLCHQVMDSLKELRTGESHNNLDKDTLKVVATGNLSNNSKAMDNSLLKVNLVSSLNNLSNLVVMDSTNLLPVVTLTVNDY
jgi:hypothetical protein